jgi:SOS-response transcriptional repressor LexA
VDNIHPIQQAILDLRKVRPLANLSYREIGRQVSDDPEKRVHPQVIKYHIEQLIGSSQLTEADRPTTVSPQQLAQPSEKPRLISLPLMGAANAGPATMLASEHPESYVKITPQLLRSKNYPDLIALRVSGNSMNCAELHGATIQNDDYIVIDRSKRTPRNGEIVVVDNDNCVNVKRIIFDYEHEQIALMSESTEHFDPIFLSAQDNVDAFVEGTVIQVIKTSSD